jgi:hypothetical protein
LKGFFTIFPCFLKIFLHFPWFFPTFFLPCSRDRNPTPPSPNCLLIHSPRKKTFGWPNHYQISSSRSTPLYSLRSRKQLCLAYRLAFVKN